MSGRIACRRYYDPSNPAGGRGPRHGYEADGSRSIDTVRLLLGRQDELDQDRSRAHLHTPDVLQHRVTVDFGMALAAGGSDLRS